jgi:hypothetical protein
VPGTNCSTAIAPEAPLGARGLGRRRRAQVELAFGLVGDHGRPDGAAALVVAQPGTGGPPRDGHGVQAAALACEGVLAAGPSRLQHADGVGPARLRDDQRPRGRREQLVTRLRLLALTGAEAAPAPEDVGPPRAPTVPPVASPASAG